MDLFFQFLAQQWILVAALLSCVALLMYHESRRGGRSLTPQQLSMLINREQAVVVDLRDAKDFSKGHIVDARNIPYNKVNDRLGELDDCRDRPVVLVCRMGQHSSAVGKTLAGKGFQQVYRLGGGMTEWQHQQLPVVKS